MGPKFEQYKVIGNANVQPLQHLDVGAGISAGKFFSDDIYLELGLWKNDYSSKFEVKSLNTDGEELKSFSNQLYPTHSTAQASILGGYLHELNTAWSMYAQGGVQFFITKKLDREGSQLFTETASNQTSGYRENIYLITYSNGFESGNLLLRADVGLCRQISDFFSLELTASYRGSSLPISEYEIEYFTDSASEVKRARVQNRGKSLGFYFGLRYKLSNR